MGEIRYYILRRVNEIRANEGKYPFFLHEELSDNTQKHTQEALEKMLTNGYDIWKKVFHTPKELSNDFNLEISNYSPYGELYSQIEGMLKGFLNSKEGHREALLNSEYSHIGAEIAQDDRSGLTVLCIRFKNI